MSGVMTPLDFLTVGEAALVAQDAAGVTSDPELSVPITYRHFTGRTFVPSTGLWTPTFTEQSLRAIRGDLSATEVVASAGQYKMGDVRYLLAKAVLAVSPGQDDQIVAADGTVFDMIRWSTDPVGAFWRLVMREVKSA